MPIACAHFNISALTNAGDQPWFHICNKTAVVMQWNGSACLVSCDQHTRRWQSALLTGGTRACCMAFAFVMGVLTYCLSAMQYGRQTVPISSEEENHLKYLPEKDMQAVGFVSLDQIPRHMYMKVLCCLSARLLFVPQRQPIQTAKQAIKSNVNGPTAHLSLQ